MPNKANLEEVVKGLLSTDIDDAKVEEVLKAKGYSEKQIQVLKAKLKLLASVKDELPAGVNVLKDLAELSGLELPEVEVEKSKKEPAAETDPALIDLAKVSKELQPQVAALIQKNKELAEQASRTSGTLAEEISRRITKEFIQKAKTELPDVAPDADAFGPVMKEAKEKLSEAHYTLLEAVLKAANAKIAEGALYENFGTGRAVSAGTAMGKIQVLAEKVAKEKNISYALAEVEIITKTAEGQKLYEEYRTEKEGAR
jgi:hypothetical protein